MKFLNILVFMFIMILPLSAAQDYEQIIITKTSYKSNLRVIKHQLDYIHVKMFVQKFKSDYIIYSGKYKNYTTALSALRLIKHYFKYARIIKHDKHSVNKKEKLDKKFFINFALGEYSLTGGGSNSGLSYMLESGYVYDKDIFVSLAYLSNSSGDVSVSNIYSSLNYTMNFNKNIDLYAGGLLGYSTLQKSGFSSSTSILFGIEFGATYKVYDDWDIFTAYQGIDVNHIVKINATTDLKLGFIHNLQFGVKYKF